MSFVVVPKDDAEERAESILELLGLKRRRDRRAFLLIELCADGHARRGPGTPRENYSRPPADSHPGDRKQRRRRRWRSWRRLLYLKAHSIRVGTKWFSGADGLLFDGTPGMTVRRIELTKHFLQPRFAAFWTSDTAAGSALQRVEHVRSKIFADADYKWAFVSEPVPLLAEAPRVLGHHQVAGVRCVPGFHWTSNCRGAACRPSFVAVASHSTRSSDLAFDADTRIRAGGRRRRNQSGLRQPAMSGRGRCPLRRSA